MSTAGPVRKVECGVQKLGAIVAVKLGSGQVQHIDLAGDHTELRAEELGERRVRQCGGAIVGRGQQGGGVYRHEGAGILEYVAAKPGIGRDLEEAAGQRPSFWVSTLSV